MTPHHYSCRFVVVGSLSAALAIAMGAFGAHLLRATLTPRLMSVYQTALLYHLFHSLGFFALAFAAPLRPASRMIRAAGYTMLGGLVLFSGSLYLLCLTGMTWLGAVTPLGGGALIAAWLMVAAGLAGRRE